jgi:hypothetical protein
MHKGDLLASKWFGGASPCQGHLVANDGGSLFVPEHRFTEILLNGSQTEKLPSRARLGFTAARSARFEHGQSGA